MLYEVIRKKFDEARKDNNVMAKEAYNAVIAKILIAEKSGTYPLPLSDNIIENIIDKQIKEYRETQSYYSSDNENYKTLQIKIDLLTSYLPKQLSEEEVTDIINKIIELNKDVNKGKLIGLCVKEIGNRFDKSKIANLVNKILSK